MSEDGSELVCIVGEVGGSRAATNIAALDTGELLLGDDVVVAFREGENPNDFYGRVADATKDALSQLGLYSGGRLDERVVGFGQGSAGIIQSDGSLIMAPNVPETFNGRNDLGPYLEQEFGLTVVVGGNDCSQAARFAYTHEHNPERWGHPDALFGNIDGPYQRRFDSVGVVKEGEALDVGVYLTTSSGTNIGVMLNGLPFNGGHGTTPELGHIQLASDSPFGLPVVDGCEYPHIEGAVTGTGLTRMLHDGYVNRQNIDVKLSDPFIELMETALEDVNNVIDERVESGEIAISTKNEREQHVLRELNAILPARFYALESDDGIVDAVKEYVADHMAKYLGIIIAAYGPTWISIGGGMSRDFDQIVVPALDRIREESKEYFIQPVSSHPVVYIAGDFGKHHVMRGAAAHVKNVYSSR